MAAYHNIRHLIPSKKRSIFPFAMFVILLAFMGTTNHLTSTVSTISCPGDSNPRPMMIIQPAKANGPAYIAQMQILNALKVEAKMEPRQLQSIAEEVLRWDQFPQAVAAAYNSCAITAATADKSINLYGSLKTHAEHIDQLQKDLTSGRQTNPEQARRELAEYWEHFRQYIETNNQAIVLARILTIAEETKESHDQLMNSLRQLQENLTPNEGLATPDQIYEIQQAHLMHNAIIDDAADSAYKKGYRLYDQYQFKNAIPYFQKAIELSKLPYFYDALAHSYFQLHDFKEAEATVRTGLRVAVDDREKAHLNEGLSEILLAARDYDGKASLNEAQDDAERALTIDKDIAGPNSPKVAADYITLGRLLNRKGDSDSLKLSLIYMKRGLQVDEHAYGHFDPRVAIIYNDIGQVLQDLGNLNEALQSTQEARKINVKLFGANHPAVGIADNNLGSIFHALGKLPTALLYAKEALESDEAAYGHIHAIVARDNNNISQISLDMENLEEALRYANEALMIESQISKPNAPIMAIRLNSRGRILTEMGKSTDLWKAHDDTKRALKIAEDVYGQGQPETAVYLNNLATVLELQNNVDDALRHANQALQIVNRIYGPNHPITARVYINLAKILADQRDFKKAEDYGEEAAAIDKSTYGPISIFLAKDDYVLSLIFCTENRKSEALRYASEAFYIFRQNYGLRAKRTLDAGKLMELLRKNKV